MRNRFALMRIVAILGLVLTFVLAGSGGPASASPARPDAVEGGAAQEAATQSEGAPVAGDPEVSPTEVIVTESPVEEPTVDVPVTEAPEVVETVVPVETEAPATATVEPSQAVTPEATGTAEPTATEAIEAAAVPTYIFPNPNVTGTVNVAKFACTGRTATTIDADVFAAAASLPSGPGSCTPTSGVMTFTFLGGLPNASQLMVQNAGSIDLPAGTYDVVDEASGVHATITLGSGQVVNLMVFGPRVGAPPTVTPGDGTVSIAVVDCTNIATTTFDIDTFSAAAQQVDCTNSSARVTFYMVGDGTADYVQRVFTRSGSISLRPGVYEIVVEETQTHKFITVQSGKVVSMVIMKPLRVTGGAVSGSAEGGSGGEVVGAPAVTPVAPVAGTDPGNPPATGTGGTGASGGADMVAMDVPAGGVAVATGATGATDRGVAGSTADSTAANAASEHQRAMPVITTLPRAGSGPDQGTPLSTAGVFAALSLLMLAAGCSLRARDRNPAHVRGR